MDRQALFNQAYLGLRNQGFQQSLHPDKYHPVCAYRGHGGLRCAIGHLLTDDEYDSVIEGSSINGCVLNLTGFLQRIGFDEAPLKPQHDDSDIWWLMDLQASHDYRERPEQMRDKLHEFARNYKLDIPE